MKYKKSVVIFGIAIFAIGIITAGISYSSNNNVSSKVKDGYRILNLDSKTKIQNFVVYRGDYIKFKLPETINESIAFFPTLKEQKPLTSDLTTTSYFKMRRAGVYPFQIDFIKGQITVIEYEQAKYKELTAKEAHAFILEESPLILDVRTPREYAMGHIQNSVLIPVQELQRRIKELDAYKNKSIFIYCATGNRSTVASKILIDSEFEKILNLRHGIVDWYKRKYPVVR